jgi:BlaI family penicillinase repressor
MDRKTRKVDPSLQLSRRERQIMEIVYARGTATSAEVQGAMADAPGYSAVRALMRILVGKGLLRHRRAGLKYLFAPVLSAKEVRHSALTRLLSSFFDNSPSLLMTTLLNSRELDASPRELRRLKSLIARRAAQRKRAP